MQELERHRVEKALRSIISDLDYDLHKNIECDEETEEDTYPDLVTEFIQAYEEASESFPPLSDHDEDICSGGVQLCYECHEAGGN